MSREQDIHAATCFMCQKPITGAHVHVGLDEICATYPVVAEKNLAPLGLDDVLKFPVCADGPDACMEPSGKGWQECNCGRSHD